MRQLVFVDSDGTLKNNQGIISENTKETLKELKSNGIEVIITTGRPRYHAIKVKDMSNASRYVISSNGAEVYDCDLEDVIFASYMNNDDVIKITDIANKYNSRCMYTVDGKEVVMDEAKNDNQVLLEGTLENFLNSNNVKQIFIRSDTEDEGIETYEEIKKLSNVKIVNESSFFHDHIVEKKGIWFSVSSIDVNKGTAIKVLCEHLNVSLENTYGFGNDYNDIKMFETVNHSIVMDNANDDLKKLAKIVAKSNDDDGVAAFLEELFIKKN